MAKTGINLRHTPKHRMNGARAAAKSKRAKAAMRATKRLALNWQRKG